MDAQEFWRQYEVSDKEFKKWEKRADKVLKRYRLEMDSGTGEVKPSFNILWANTSVLQPSLFSQIPKPDIRRRYKDDDPVAKEGGKVLERALEFVMDDGEENDDFFEFGKRTVFDYLLPGMTVCKVRYVPTYSKTSKTMELEERDGGYYAGEDAIDPEKITFQDGTASAEVEVNEVVDEHVEIDRWPWKNFRHQKAKRWKDVGWIDYISFLDKGQLKKLFPRKWKDIQLTVDGSGNDSGEGGFKATHAEVHEVWFCRERKVRIGAKGNEDKWLREGGDPLRLKSFYPTPQPLMAVDTNDSLQPIPLFTLYQHQANELDNITKRISILMDALKLAGLYAGQEKETLKKLFEADENQMIPVEDWGTIQGAGGIKGLVDWLPVEQVGKVLTALFREREAIVQQIFELTGIADIQRGNTDPRETKGAQVLKAQFSSRRTLTPKQEVERYFRGVLRIAGEVIAEHFSPDTLERMTGLPVSDEVYELLSNEVLRQYRIDIETDSTVAPDEEAEQANMAKALEAVTAYITAIAPLVQQGMDQQAALQLLKVYLRKFRWGREIEDTLEQLERMPQQQKPDPEMQKMQMEAQQKHQEFMLKLAEKQADIQMKQQEFQLKLQELIFEIQAERAKSEQELEQDREKHQMKLVHEQQTHEQSLVEQRELANAKAVQVRQGNQDRPSA